MQRRRECAERVRHRRWLAPFGCSRTRSESDGGSLDPFPQLERIPPMGQSSATTWTSVIAQSVLAGLLVRSPRPRPSGPAGGARPYFPTPSNSPSVRRSRSSRNPSVRRNAPVVEHLTCRSGFGQSDSAILTRLQDSPALSLRGSRKSTRSTGPDHPAPAAAPSQASARLVRGPGPAERGVTDRDCLEGRRTLEPDRTTVRARSVTRMPSISTISSSGEGIRARRSSGAVAAVHPVARRCTAQIGAPTTADRASQRPTCG